MKMTRNFGQRGATKSTGSEFERRKAWAVKSAAERVAEAEWNGVERRRQVSYSPAERVVDQSVRKVHFEGLATYAVIAACLGFAFWQIGGMGVEGYQYIVANLSNGFGH